MMHAKSQTILLYGSALVGIALFANPVNADTQTTTSTSPNQVTNITASSANSTATSSSAVTVITNHDQAAKPSETTDWAKPADYQDKVPVQILGINDFHGGLELGGKAQIDGKTYQNTGTAARLASYLNVAENDFKQANPTGTTIRVEAGDIVGASPANSALLQDESTMHALSAMRIAIGTLGNHEFDEGLPEFLRIVNGEVPTKEYNEAEMAYPHTPSGISIITANVVDKKTGKVPFGLQPYLIKEIHTSDNQVTKIGFIGIETTSLPILTLYDNYKDYDILDEAETIVKYAKILRNQGVNAIVVLAHTAVESSDGKTKGDAVDILQKVNQLDPNNSVDVYLAAHSHQYANATVGQTHLVQAIYTGKAYDDIIGYLDPATNDFIANSLVAHVYPVLSETDDPTTKADPKVQAIVADANARVATIINKKIGEAATNQTITGRLNNSKTMENGAGEIVVDAQLHEAKKAGLPADFAMTNTGGVRADIVVGPDKSITWGAAQAVQPFGNILRVVKMTGAQIRQALNQQYDENQKFYLQIAGLKYTYTDQADANQPYRVVKMYKTDGTPIKDDQAYNVVINDFLAGGGDGFSAFKNTELVGIVGQDTEAFIDYITSMTKAGTPIKTPALDRKIYLTNVQVATQEETKTSDPVDTTDQTQAIAEHLSVTAENAEAIGKPQLNQSSKATSQATTSINLALTNNKKENQQKQLPQTGTQNNNSIFALIGISLIFILGLRVKRKIN